MPSILKFLDGYEFLNSPVRFPKLGTPQFISVILGMITIKTDDSTSTIHNNLLNGIGSIEMSVTHNSFLLSLRITVNVLTRNPAQNRILNSSPGGIATFYTRRNINIRSNTTCKYLFIPSQQLTNIFCIDICP